MWASRYIGSGLMFIALWLLLSSFPEKVGKNIKLQRNTKGKVNFKLVALSKMKWKELFFKGEEKKEPKWDGCMENAERPGLAIKQLYDKSIFTS